MTKLFGQNQWTALMFVADLGHLEIVKLLLAHPGVDANMQDKVNYSSSVCKRVYFIKIRYAYYSRSERRNAPYYRIL